MTSGSMQLTAVRPSHRFDEAALAQYLTTHLPGCTWVDMTVRQFAGGQSNPTYHLQTIDGAFVLRKKPAGPLIPSAHAVEREFKVLAALAGSTVPVPKVHLLCEDASILGQSFYVMEHVEGRVFTDRLLPGCSARERAAMYDDMNRVLAELHLVDFRDIGLADFGRADGYVPRQVARWSRQYRDSRVVDVPAMDALIEWLPAHLPDGDEARIAHGDFRIGNLVFHPSEPRVVAVLDWELATIGHPLADLAYNCLAYRLPYLGGRGFGDADIAALGIPAEAAYVAGYCRRTGRDHIANWEFFVVLSLFRTASIQVGIHRRALQGNAADTTGVDGATYSVIAEAAWDIARYSTV
jgi:aminoglycoside phosphotransferase (APT) family kinase protein